MTQSSTQSDKIGQGKSAPNAGAESAHRHEKMAY
jgi:hypothetical protein